MASPVLHAPHLGGVVNLRTDLDLAAVPSAVGVTRLWLRTTLTEWGAGWLVDNAWLVATELVTNAINACRQADSDGHCCEAGLSKLIRLRLLGMPHTVAVEVWDRCPGEPSLRPVTDPLAEGGRGLHVVEALSLRWGVYPMRPSGKVVWSELAASASGSSGFSGSSSGSSGSVTV
jgi:anti-sigma regulatory factor (Ser/Thr protein kinase)